MPKEFSRMRRVNEQVRRELAEIIRRESDDPGLQMVSISGVDVAKDLAMARVYITVLGEPEERSRCLALLRQGAGFYRSQLGRHVRLKYTPRLEFLEDTSLETGQRLSELIEEARRKDRERGAD